MTENVKAIITNAPETKDFLSQDRYSYSQRSKTRQQIRKEIAAREATLYTPNNDFCDWTSD